MKNQVLRSIFFLGLVAAMLSGCTGTNRTMREPNAHMQWEKSDFTYSEQVEASASTTRILMIDWSRLFDKKSGSVQGGGSSLIDLASVPVVGPLLIDRTANYALYELMQANPGYDVVFYPQYETVVKRPIGLGFIYSKTDVKVTARLGKIN